LSKRGVDPDPSGLERSGCCLKGLSLLKYSVHIDIHPTILYVFDMFNISE